jgi:hypothetical protein
MKTLTILMSLLIFSLGIFGQGGNKKEAGSVIGVFSSESVSRTFGQQIAMQNPPTREHKWTHI